MTNRIEKLEETRNRNHPSKEEDFIDQTVLESENSKNNDRNKRAEKKESAGNILKKAREAQGLSLEIVHESTKIPLDALRAIEEGYRVRMLSPFYYTGFVKMYAIYLNIDISEVIEDYKQEQLPEHIDPNFDEEFELPSWINKLFTRERKQQIVIIAGALLALFLFTKVIGFIISRKPQIPVKKDAAKTATDNVKKRNQESCAPTSPSGNSPEDSKDSNTKNSPQSRT